MCERERESVCVSLSFTNKRNEWILKSGKRLVTGWSRLIGSPMLQVIFCKRATNYRALLWKVTYEDKGSYESSPPYNSREVETWGAGVETQENKTTEHELICHTPLISWGLSRPRPEFRRSFHLTCLQKSSMMVQPIADRVAQHLEIISKNFQFSTRRTRILMGFITYYLVLIVNPMGRILVRRKRFSNNLEMLCHPICNWL